MKAQLLGVLLALAIATPAMADIKEEPVTYKDGETTLKGAVVYDTAKEGKRPGIVMVHEWWGITKHIHNEARAFAEQGYTVFIPTCMAMPGPRITRRMRARSRAPS